MKRSAIALVGLGILLAGSGALKAQDTLRIRGVIRAGNGDPVANVAVSEEGSARLPVVTDSLGQFSMVVGSGSSWLIVSPAGDLKPRRIYLNGRKELDFYLTGTDRISGDDVLLILEQEGLRRNMVAAHSEPDFRNRHHGSDFTLDEYMQGNVAGMYTLHRSGDMGSGAVATLRGVRSIYANNNPLYIVDGVPVNSLGLFSSNLAGFQYNALLAVNVFDISRAMVVKDPAFTAAYGSRGSNGLVVIETLDPSVTQTTIDVDARTGYSLAPPNQIPQLNATQHKTLMNEILFSTGHEEEYLREVIPGLFLEPDDERFIDYQHNTNWQDYVFDNSMFYNFNMQVKGGDEIARYGLSFGYMDSEGIVRETGFSGYNLRFVSLLNIFTWLKMDAGVSLNYNTSSLKEAALVSETSPLMTALAKSPLLNPYQYDAEGSELTTLAEVDEIGVSNPLAAIENYQAINTNYNFTASLGFEATVNRDLSVNSKFSFNYDVMKESQFLPNLGMEPYVGGEADNISKAANNDLNSLYNNTYLLFRKQFGNDHILSSNTGMNILSNRYQFDWGLTKNAHPNDEYRDLQDGQDNLREIGGANRNWNWISVYENLNYAFMDRYLVTASISLDGSSRIGDNADNTLGIGNSRFGLFYSAGLGWRVSGEPFLRDLSWLENLKLRVSWGKTGNDDIGESSASDYYTAIKFRETVGLYPGLIANDRLTYETVTQLNTGLDLSLLGNRFMASADYFVSNTSDMIIFNPVEAYFGYDFRIENGGNIQNKGVELSAFLRIVDGSNFKWDLSGTYSKVHNEITSIEGDQQVYSVPGAEKINREGEEANSFYGYVFEGVYASTAEALDAGLVNARGVEYGGGDAIYSDLSGPGGTRDGVINEYDKTIIGSPHPDFFGGISTVLSFRNLSLSATMSYAVGQDVFNYVRYRNESMTDLSNQSVQALSRWQYEGQATDVPRAVWNDPMGNTDFSSRWIEDASFLRLRNITLSYRIPDQFLVFKNAEFYVSANNLVTLSDYLGYDPEFAYSQSQIYQGIDYGMTPHARQFIAGIKVGL